MSHSGRRTRSIVLAVGVHLLVLLVLGVSFNWKSHIFPVAPPGENLQPVQASVVPEDAVEQEMARIRQLDEQKKRDEQEQVQRVEDLISQAEKLEAERKRKEQELARIEEQKAVQKEQARKAREEREREEKRLADEKARREAEEQALAERKKQEAEKKRKAEEKALAEKKRKAEAERKRKEAEKKLAEKKRREEEAKKAQEARRLAEEKRKREEAEAELQARMIREEAESALLSNISLIQNAVSRNWIQPSSYQPGQTAQIAVKVSTSGEVIDARITKSSGDPNFDRSVYAAVLKASPLPIPQDPRYYPHINNFQFNFNPTG